MNERRPEMMGLAQTNWLINDIDVSAKGADLMTQLSALHLPVAETVAKAVSDGKRPITIAGDCCSSIPMLAGLQRSGINPFLIWMDAHGDFNTFETSPSGFVFGMPFAMLCGLGDQRLTQAVGLKPLRPDQAVLTDGRDLDPGERELILAQKLPWAKKVEDVLARLPTDSPLWVHFDTDILDPSDSPNMLYRVPGGQPLQAIVNAAHVWAATGRIAAISMTTWTISQDYDRRSENAAMAVLAALMNK